MTATYLLVIAEREALAWILRDERMAFPSWRTPVERLAIGDSLLLLTTRGCYHNPGRDATLVMGRAEVTSLPVTLDNPVMVAGRTFPIGCDIDLQTLAPMHEGVALAPLVERLEVFPNKPAWPATLRRALVPLGSADATLIGSLLSGVAKPAGVHRARYIETIKPVASTGRGRR